MSFCKRSSMNVMQVQTLCRKVTDSSEILMLGGSLRFVADLVVCVLFPSHSVALKGDSRSLRC